MSNPITTRLFIALATAGLALGLSACREEEQNRPLTFEKGVYGGQADQVLSQAQRDELKSRMQIQNY